MQIDILTLFPDMIRPVLSQSILGKAVERGHLTVDVHDFRSFTADKHGKVDDKPYGGGPGMVLACQPLIDCVESLLPDGLTTSPDARTAANVELVMLSPQGEPLRQPRVRQLATRARLVMLCGRYEGFDDRIRDILRPTEISIGDYILTGGEPAAIVLVDAVARLLPGVLGHDHSAEFESFDEDTNRLDYPVYTRPLEYRGHTVPDVLLSGDHEAVARWRLDESVRRTAERRPDLIDADPAPDRSQVDHLANVSRQPRGWRKTGDRPPRPDGDPDDSSPEDSAPPPT